MPGTEIVQPEGSGVPAVGLLGTLLYAVGEGVVVPLRARELLSLRKRIPVTVILWDSGRNVGKMRTVDFG